MSVLASRLSITSLVPADVLPLAADTRQVIAERERHWAHMTPTDRIAWFASRRRAWQLGWPAQQAAWFTEPLLLGVRQGVLEQVFVALGVLEGNGPRELSDLIIDQRGSTLHQPTVLRRMLRYAPAFGLSYCPNGLQELARTYHVHFTKEELRYEEI